MRQAIGLCGAVALCGLLGIATPASATTINVVNSSFEDGLNTGTSCGTGCYYTPPPTGIAGWTLSDQNAEGYFQPGASGVYNYVPDGFVVAYAGDGTISQTVAAVSQAGLTYTLQVAVGNRIGLNGSGSATEELIIGGVPTIATGTLPTSGNWSDYMATYIAPTSGLAIEILLTAGTPQAGWDNVRLTDNVSAEGGAAPLPAALPLFATGLGAMGLFGWRRKRKAAA